MPESKKSKGLPRRGERLGGGRSSEPREINYEAILFLLIALVANVYLLWVFLNL